jgi:hypothetical protein
VKLRAWHEWSKGFFAAASPQILSPDCVARAPRDSAPDLRKARRALQRIDPDFALVPVSERVPAPPTELLTVFALKCCPTVLSNVMRALSETEVGLLTLEKKRLDGKTLPLWKAFFCLDCGVIGDGSAECPACKSQALVRLARVLGGILLAHRTRQFQKCEGALFDTMITIELRQVDGKDLSILLERLVSVIGPKLARDQNTFHTDVRPMIDGVKLQDALHFPERDAA